ncbi:MAG: cyclic nucleotide-binding domain-containing protein [Candidatus Latescibacteria bacterium]|nr:cyclic nucleotide-binding domain-containing protein [Candidatus Latescibacterota bacterium]
MIATQRYPIRSSRSSRRSRSSAVYPCPKSRRYSISVSSNRSARDRTCTGAALLSTDLFILLEGSLGVRTSAGVEISQIYPIGLVGEMGVLTREPRSADVVAIEDVIGFSIQQDDLDDLFIRHAEIGRKMLINVIQNLSRKLYNANVQLEQLKSILPNLSKEADKLLGGNIFLY